MAWRTEGPFTAIGVAKATRTKALRMLSVRKAWGETRQARAGRTGRTLGPVRDDAGWLTETTPKTGAEPVPEHDLLGGAEAGEGNEEPRRLGLDPLVERSNLRLRIGQASPF